MGADIQKKIDDLQERIDEKRKKQKKIDKAISNLVGLRDGWLVKLNEPSFGDIEWLINNPNEPGQWKAMREWLKETFGGEYRGVSASGYYPDINQQAFGFVLEMHDGDADEYIANVYKFAEITKGMLNPARDGFVDFSYKTGQYSGIFQISLKVDDGTWWTSNTRYGFTCDEVKHNSLGDAIQHALSIIPTVDD